jgi:hypothetical protein
MNNTITTLTTSQQIEKIFDENRLNDLKRFLDKRHCLNDFNTFLVFLFYLVQSSGIMVTMIGSAYNNQQFIWIGIGLNLTASLINVYEKVNNNLMKNMLTNIQAIKNNNYVDEAALVDLENINIPVPPQPQLRGTPPVQNQIVQNNVVEAPVVQDQTTTDSPQNP